MLVDVRATCAPGRAADTLGRAPPTKPLEARGRFCADPAASAASATSHPSTGTPCGTAAARLLPAATPGAAAAAVLEDGVLAGALVGALVGAVVGALVCAVVGAAPLRGDAAEGCGWPPPRGCAAAALPTASNSESKHPPAPQLLSPPLVEAPPPRAPLAEGCAGNREGVRAGECGNLADLAEDGLAGDLGDLGALAGDLSDDCGGAKGGGSTGGVAAGRGDALAGAGFGIEVLARGEAGVADSRGEPRGASSNGACA